MPEQEATLYLTQNVGVAPATQDETDDAILPMVKNVGAEQVDANVAATNYLYQTKNVEGPPAGSNQDIVVSNN